jgi:hypothetical protein
MAVPSKSQFASSTLPMTEQLPSTRSNEGDFAMRDLFSLIKQSMVHRNPANPAVHRTVLSRRRRTESLVLGGQPGR